MTIIPGFDGCQEYIDVGTPHECPLCGNFTQFYQNVRGATYCYQCVPINHMEEA